ncbi:MAG: high-potential iron-sulfur protein [Cyclobacteriaceae bacterium]
MNRRLVIKKSFALTFGIIGGGILVSGCGSEKQEEYNLEDIKDCSDLSGLSEEEKNKRKTLGYLEETPIPENNCANCQLYLPPVGERKCGGCQLFKGPVKENAYCTYWAPIPADT